jgi:AAA15 family ATPase/GTPase
LSFITSSGIDISDIGVKTDTRKAPSHYEKKQGESFAETAELEIKTSRPVFIHNYGDGLTEEFELSEESIGTQRLFYLSPYILNAMKTGGTIVIDELESSMHPMLVRFVVNCFNSAKNKNGAQLIFSTHNSSLLDIKEVFRRDQIWFAERDESQATVLYPLTDFNPRKEASVESGYLSGRYGAVPFLKDFYLDLGADEGGGDGA